MPKSYGKRTAPYPKRKYNGAKGFTRTAPAFRKKVLSVVKRTQEVKNQVLISSPTVIQLWDAATTSLTDDILTNTVLGSISQGPSDGERIGNKISIRSWVIKGSVVSTSASQRPFYLKVIIAKQKQQATGNPIFQNLYEGGSAGPTQPTNQLRDIFSPLNKDAYTIYAARVFKLGPSTPESYPNNDFSVSKMFSIDLSKHIKSAQYDATSSTAPAVPNNIHMFWVGCFADNFTVNFDPYGGPAATVEYSSYVRYTDD